MKELSFGKKRICVLSEDERVLSEEQRKEINDYIFNIISGLQYISMSLDNMKLKYKTSSELLEKLRKDEIELHHDALEKYRNDLGKLFID
jgi:aspartokinase